MPSMTSLRHWRLRPAIATGSWVTFDIPLTAFTGLVTRGHLAQLIFVGDDPTNTVFIDNVLLHR